MAIFKTATSILLIVISNSFISQTNKKLGIMYGVGYNTQVKENNKIAPVSFAYYNTFSPIVGLVYRDSIYKFLSLKPAMRALHQPFKFASISASASASLIC